LFGPVVAFGAAEGDPFGLPRSAPFVLIPVVESLFMEPLSIDPLFMPDLFILSLCAAGPVAVWAKAELHMRVRTLASIILRIVFSLDLQSM
jgi:hypothetical protein